jgi:hypothetical protein
MDPVLDLDRARLISALGARAPPLTVYNSAGIFQHVFFPG